MGSIPVGVTKISSIRVERTKNLFYFYYFYRDIFLKSRKIGVIKMEEEKENNKMIRKKIFENIIIAIAIMIYFIIINFSYLRMDESILLQGIKIASIVILFFSIIIFEVAYRKDSGRIAINGIEVLVLAIHTLTIWTVINRFKIEFDTYVLISTYTFAIYYILKSIIIYTIEKKKYLDSLSDIHEIVSNEPIKKEAKKRKKKENT